MAAQPAAPTVQAIALKWSNLADRRLTYYIELYQSGRWRHYYDEAQFLDRLREVVQAADSWDQLSRARPGAGGGAYSLS